MVPQRNRAHPYDQGMKFHAVDCICDILLVYFYAALAHLRASQKSPMSKIGIWFTQGYANLFNALNDIRAGDASGAFTLICSHTHPQFVGGAAADESLVEPKNVDEAQYLAFVLDTIARYNVRVIFPSRKQAFFNRHAAQLSELGVQVATVASTATLQRIDNKAKLYASLANKGIALIPRYFTARTAQSLTTAYRSLRSQGLVVCVKPTHGVYGSGFRILKDGPATMKDLLSESMTMPVADLRARMRKDPGTEMLVMELLEGDERSVDCFAVAGQLVTGVVRRKSASGVAPQVIEDNPAVMAQVRALTRHLKLNGLFNIQFKDHDGLPYLLEINTRLSGRSYYATVAGANLPYLAAQVFSGQTAFDDLTVTPLKTGLLLGNASHAVQLGFGMPAPVAGVLTKKDVS